MKFFTLKIDHIRAQFAHVVSDTIPLHPITTATLDQFQGVSHNELWDIVKHMKILTTPHDPIPPQIIKDAFDVIGPSILVILNSSLASGIVPTYLKHAVVQPMQKKHNLDAKCYNNFRPISKLPFISKILEKVVLTAALISQFHRDP